MKFLTLIFCVISFLFCDAIAQQNVNKFTSKEVTVNGKLEVNSTTLSSRPCPAMSEAQRDAISSPVNGSCVYNTDTLSLNIYNGTIWKSAGGGISNWETAFNYAVGDVVIESNKIYQCDTAHTSSVFATDIANWTQLANNVSDSTGILPLVNGGTSKALSASAGAIAYSDADSIELSTVGTSGQVLKSNGVSAPAFANASISVKSENNTATTSEEIQVPNNSLTETASNKHLIETGNFNALVNPGGEHFTSGFGWTAGVGSFTTPTTAFHSGKQSVRITSTLSALILTQTSTINAAALTNTQGIASAWINTSRADMEICALVDGTETNCVAINSDGVWREYVIPFVFGSTSYGIIVQSTATGTGAVSIDDAYLGFMPATMTPEVAQAQLAVDAYFAGTTNCTGWTRISTTIGPVSSDADCPGPTIVLNRVGSAQTTDSDLPRVTVNNLPAGDYKAKFLLQGSGSASINGFFAINDGTSTCYAVPQDVDGTLARISIVECSFSYTSSGNRSFELYVASNSGTVTVGNSRTSPAGGTRFILEYYPPASKVYSQPNNVDTDWVDCGLTTSDFTGFGTVSSIEDLCKKDGADLLMRVKFVSGTSTATEARVNLKLAGTALNSASSAIIPTLQIAGVAARSNPSSTETLWSLIEPAVGYTTFGVQVSTTSALTKQNGSAIIASGATMFYNARVPVNGWTKSQITGTFAEMKKAIGVSKPVDFSFRSSSAGAVSNPIGASPSSCSVTATSTYTCTLPTTLAVAPNCVCSPNGDGECAVLQANTTTSQVQFITENSGGTATAIAATVLCFGSSL